MPQSSAGGSDPIEARQKRREVARLEAAQCAERYIEDHSVGWRNAKHAAQWTTTLERYAYPVFGSAPVQAIDTGLVTKVLRPIWKDKTETATRVRQRVEAVLDWATAHGHRSGDNPARWRGYLDKLLPKRSKVQRDEEASRLATPQCGLVRTPKTPPSSCSQVRLSQGSRISLVHVTIIRSLNIGKVLEPSSRPS
jgi:hypothetical protein